MRPGDEGESPQKQSPPQEEIATPLDERQWLATTLERLFVNHAS